MDAQLLKLALLHDEVVCAAYDKRAGGFSKSLLPKGRFVYGRQIIAAMKAEGGFTMDYFDFKQVEYDTVDPKVWAMDSTMKGAHGIWRVYPKGEFGNRKSEYVWGTVSVGMKLTSNKGFEIAAVIYVKT